MDTKRNDWLATIINQPQFDFEDMQEHGITPDNTTIKSKDFYKSLPQIQEIFRDKDGKFDDILFDNYYMGALQAYNDYANQQFTDEMIKTYDPYDWTAPIGSKNKDTSVTISIGDNPERKSYGISNLNEIGKSNLSIREIAQTNQVWDPVTEDFLDWSPNDKGGFFKALNRPTLALAIWDEDGTHEVNGRIFRHSKGDMRLNEKGEPFYEILTPDKEVYGRDILHYTDTFTVDGSKWNQYDFFDSDSINKSIGGTIMKTAVGVAPMLIPGVGTVFGLASAGLALTQLIPILGKSISNIRNGDKDTEFEKTLNKIESWGAQFQSSVSDKSRQKIATWENLGQLVKDVSLQLFQQQSIGKIPLLFGKTQQNAELGRNLALAYMAGTSAQQAYESFKEAGANDRTAGLGMLASMFAMWKLMNIDYFRDSLFKGTFFDESITKKPIREAAQETAKSLGFMNPNQGFTWLEAKLGQKVADAARKTVGRVAKIGDPNSTSNIFLMRAVNEGVEETMEEVSQDAVKALFTAVDALGIPMTSEQDKDLDFNWNLGDATTRYLTSFIGGAIGGPIFELHNRWQNRLNNNITKSMDRSSFSQIAYLLAQNKKDEVDKYLELDRKRGKFGSKNLSGIKYQIKTNADGKKEIIYDEAAEGESQNDIIYNQLRSYVDNMQRIMDEEGLVLPLGDSGNLNLFKAAIISPDSFKNILDGELLENINTLGANSSKLNDIQKLTERIVRLRNELDALTEQNSSNSDQKTDQQQDALRLQSNKQIQKLQQDLADARTQFEQIKTGKLDGYYLNQAKFVLTPALSKLFAITDKNKYAFMKTGSDYDVLSDDQKAEIDEDFDIYMNNEAKYRIFKGYDIYLNASQAFAERIQQEDESLKNVKYNELFSGNVQGSVLESIANDIYKLDKTIKSLQDKEDSGEQLTKEEKATLEDLKAKRKQRDQDYGVLSQLPARTLLDETTDKFTFFDRTLLDTYNSEDAALYAKGLIEYYQYLANNNIISKGDKDLYFLNSLVVRNWAIGDFRERAKKAFKDVYFDVDAKREELESTEGDVQDWFTFGDRDSTTGKPKNTSFAYSVENIEYNLPAELAEVTSNDTFFNELQNGVKRFNSAVQTDITEALNVYRELISLFDKQPALKDKAEDYLKQILPDINGLSIVDYIQDVQKAKENVKSSSILSLLNDFMVAVNGEPVKLLTLINKEKQRLLDKHTIDDYVIEDETTEKQIAETIGYLNVLEAMLEGAYSGLNESINNTSKIYKLAVIGENSKNIFNSEIDTLRSELATLSYISALNKSKRLSIHQKVEANMRPKFITKLDEYLTSFKEKLNIGLEPLKQKYFGELNLKNADISNWKDYEPKIIGFETELGQSLRAEYNKNPDTYLDKLINLVPKDIWQRITSNLTDDPKEIITGFDELIYLLILTAIDSTEFYSKYKERVIDNDDYNFAPILGQEQAVKLTYAFNKNPELFNKINEKIANLVPDEAKKDKYMANKPSLPNMIKIMGAAGSGKTSATDSAIYQMFNDDPNNEFIFVAPGQAQLESLVKNITGNSNTNDSNKFTKHRISNTVDNTTHTTKGIIEELVKDGKIEFKEENDHFKGDYILEPKGILSTKDKRKIIFVDEASFFNEPELKLLSDYATKYNALIVLTGDQTQNGVKTKGKYSGLDDVNIIGATELGFTMRQNSEASIDNFQSLYSILKQVQDQYKRNPWYDIKKLDDLVTPYLTKKLNIKYYAGQTDDDAPIVGTMIVQDDKDILDWANKLIKTSGKDVIFITDKVDTWKSKLPEEYQNKIYTPENVQGLEATYAIIDVDWNNRGNDSRYNVLRDFYTLTQRASHGTIVKDNNVKEKLNIANLSDRLFKNVVEISKDQIMEFKNWRKQALASLAPVTEVKTEETSNNNGETSDDNTVTPNNSKLDPKNNEPTPQVKPQQDNPTPGNNNTSEPKNNDNTPDDGNLPNPEEAQKEEEELNNQSNSNPPFTSDELTDPEVTGYIPENFDLDDADLRGGNYSKHLRNKEFIKETFNNSKYSAINNDDYFYWMKDNLIRQQKNNPNSLFNKFEFVDENGFLRFAKQVSDAILFNDAFDFYTWDSSDFVNNIFENNRAKVSAFENFLTDLRGKENKLNTDIYELEIQNIGNKRFIIARFNINKKLYDLPIAIVDTVRTGRFKTKRGIFSLVRGATKFKTGRIRTISQINSEGRIKVSEPSVISVSKKTNVSMVPSVNKFIFGERNQDNKLISQPQNGKVVTLFTDNSNMTQSRFIADFGYETDPNTNEVTYLYKNHNQNGLMGVHKAANPETTLKAVIALYAMMIDSQAYSLALTINDANNAKTKDARRTKKQEYLAAIGIDNDKQAETLILNNIPNYTLEDGQKPFYNFDKGEEKISWAKFFEYYGDDSRQVINYNTMAKLFTTVLAMFYNPSLNTSVNKQTLDQVRDNLFELFNSRPYDSDKENGIPKSRSRNRVGLKVNGQYFAIDRRTQGNNHIYTIYKRNNNYKLEKYGDDVSVSIVNDMQYPAYQPVKVIFDNLGLDFKTDFTPDKVQFFFNTIKIKLDSTQREIFGTEVAYPKCVNETIYKLFRKVRNIDDIVRLIKNSGYFKEGFFTNDVAGSYYQHMNDTRSGLRRVKESENAHGQTINGNYTTDVEFEGSIFSVNLDLLDDNYKDDTPNDIQNYDEDLLLIKEFLKENNINYRIPVVYESKDLSKSNRDQFTELIEDINNVLKNTATDFKYPQLSNSWIGTDPNTTRLANLHIDYIESPINLINNLLRSIGVFDSSFNNNLKSTGKNRNIYTFSVTLSNNQIQNYIMRKQGTKWDIHEFLSWNSYNNALNIINSTFALQSQLNTPLDGQQVILDYFNSIQDDVVDYSIAEAYEILMERHGNEDAYKQIRDSINNYLLERLKNNEC